MSNGAEVIDHDEAGSIDPAEIIVQLNRIEQRLILLTGDALAHPVSGVGTPQILGIQQTLGTIVDRLDAEERTVEVNTAIDDRDEVNRNAAATNWTRSWPRAATSFRPVS